MTIKLHNWQRNLSESSFEKSDLLRYSSSKYTLQYNPNFYSPPRNKKKMKFYLLLFITLCTTAATAQYTLQGMITNQAQTALIGVNIYLISDPNIGTTTDADGRFELDLSETSTKSNLMISYTGYEQQVHQISSLLNISNLKLTLQPSEAMLESVTIQAAPPIAEEFSVTKLDRLDIYKNPIAAADPLRALTVLPASTNTDESANPNLRGSSSVRSRVLLNGVPVFKPVRNTQINGLGNFSLFNTEIVSSQTVYAGNPPLIYGNATAGLVDIKTRKKVAANSTQLAISLANVGVMMTRKISDKGFYQAYGNYQFSAPFLALHPNSLDFLNRFSINDVGINFHYGLSKHWKLNVFSYGIIEDYGATIQQLNFEATAAGDKKRNFNILNLAYQKGKHFLTFNQGGDFSRATFQFGNLTSNEREQNTYSSLDYKYYFSDEFSIQTGLSYQYFDLHLSGQAPIYFYASAADDPSEAFQTNLSLHDLQYYAYTKWQVSPTIIFGAGMRSNLLSTAADRFVSAQASLRFQPSEPHRFLLAAGQYHNYNTPNFLNQNYDLLSSRQLAVEYEFSTDQLQLTAALYQKTEAGDVLNYDRQRTNARTISGAEFSIAYQFDPFWSVSLANSFVDAQFEAEGETHRAANDMNYFLKLGLQYNNLALASVSLFYLQRPGTYFTPIAGGVFNPVAAAYQPIFENSWNTNQFGTYHSLNLALSKYFAFGNFDVIAFLNINNLLNITNESSPLYNTDFSTLTFDHFSKRVLYFGGVLSWWGEGYILVSRSPLAMLVSGFE